LRTISVSLEALMFGEMLGKNRRADVDQGIKRHLLRGGKIRLIPGALVIPNYHLSMPWSLAAWRIWDCSADVGIGICRAYGRITSIVETKRAMVNVGAACTAATLPHCCAGGEHTFHVRRRPVPRCRVQHASSPATCSPSAQQADEPDWRQGGRWPLNSV